MRTERKRLALTQPGLHSAPRSRGRAPASHTQRSQWRATRATADLTVGKRRCLQQGRVGGDPTDSQNHGRCHGRHRDPRRDIAA